jgi:hypothetical protein
LKAAQHQAPWHKRVGWLVLIWSLSIVALGIVTMLLRWFMHAAGMTT